MDHILESIKSERGYQKERWGGVKDDAENNGPADWTAYIAKYSTGYLNGLPPHDYGEDFRTAMLKVATLAVAAIEASEYKEKNDA